MLWCRNFFFKITRSSGYRIQQYISRNIKVTHSRFYFSPLCIITACLFLHRAREDCQCGLLGEFCTVCMNYMNGPLEKMKLNVETCLKSHSPYLLQNIKLLTLGNMSDCSLPDHKINNYQLSAHTNRNTHTSILKGCKYAFTQAHRQRCKKYAWLFISGKKSTFSSTFLAGSLSNNQQSLKYHWAMASFLQ